MGETVLSLPGYRTPDAKRQRENGRVHGDLGSVQDGPAASAEGTEVEEGSPSQDAEPSRQLQADATGRKELAGGMSGEALTSAHGQPLIVSGALALLSSS